jgi:hypothetical protein
MSKLVLTQKKIIIMGRIKKGILGGFSGKIGTVVGANWKQIAYMRSLPQKVKNPRTEAQLRQRSKIALVVNLLKPLNPLLRIGWKHHTGRQSAFNAATSYALANAITGTFPNFAIDYKKVLVSRGNLPPIVDCTGTPSTSKVEVTWGNNSNDGTAQTTDKLHIVVLNPAKETAIILEGEKRSKGTQSITIPTTWKNDKAHIYLSFVSDDGKEVSNSVCIDNLTLQ